jgi:transposase
VYAALKGAKLVAGRKRRRHSDEFQQEAVKQVTEQGYSVAEAARNLGVHENLVRTWKKKLGAEANGSELSEDERMELARLRAENKRLRMERDILKKATAFFENEKH